MQPASKKIKLDWPALINDYPNNPLMFHCDEDALYEAFKCMQQMPELKDQVLQILLNEMIEPIAGIEQYLLNDPTPSMTSCKLLLSKCTLHKRDALIQMLSKHQGNLENLYTISSVFIYPIVKVCEKLLDVFTAILNRFPIYISPVRKFLELEVNISNSIVPLYLKRWFPLITNDDSTFYPWQTLVGNYIEHRARINNFDADMEDLTVIVANRACLSNSDLILGTLVEFLGNSWSFTGGYANIMGHTIRALFYCYKDEQKKFYLPDSANLATLKSNAKYRADLKSMHLLNCSLSDDAYKNHLEPILQQCIRTKQWACLLGRALCVSRTLLEMEQTKAMEVVQAMPYIPLQLKIGLCTAQWSIIHLHWLHGSVVDWLQEDDIDYESFETYKYI